MFILTDTFRVTRLKAHRMELLQHGVSDALALGADAAEVARQPPQGALHGSCACARSPAAGQPRDDSAIHVLYTHQQATRLHQSEPTQ